MVSEKVSVTFGETARFSVVSISLGLVLADGSSAPINVDCPSMATVDNKPSAVMDSPIVEESSGLGVGLEDLDKVKSPPLSAIEKSCKVLITVDDPSTLILATVDEPESTGTNIVVTSVPFVVASIPTEFVPRPSTLSVSSVITVERVEAAFSATAEVVEYTTVVALELTAPEEKS